MMCFTRTGLPRPTKLPDREEIGRAYFLRVGPRPGWLFARAAIHEIPEAEGPEVVTHVVRERLLAAESSPALR
jgi:hypothetical protein